MSVFKRLHRILKLVVTLSVGLCFSLQVLADQLVLYTTPSPYGINWHTPHTLIRSVLRNHSSSQPHEIGHVAVGLYCSDRGLSGNPDLLTGMTSAVDNSQELLLRQGYGLGILFHNFEGRVNTWDEVLTDINLGVRSGRLSFMAFDISRATCQRLMNYETEFRERGYDQSYGLTNRPLYGEGAGCSAFGVSFLEVAGVDTNLFFGDWGRSLRVPTRLVGGPLTGYFVPLARFILNPLAMWAIAREPWFPLSFWDPDRMHAYVHRVNAGSITMPFTGEMLSWGNAKGLRMNLLGVPTPAGPIFRQ